MDKIQNYTNNYKYGSGVTFHADNAAVYTPSVKIPDLYYFNTNTTTKQKGEKKKINPFLEIPLEFLGIAPWIENPLIMAPVTVATLFGIGKFSDSFNGEYEKSSVGKAAKLGDKIGGSRLMQSNFVQTIKNKTYDGAKAVKKFLCKNDAIRAMFETPGMPEWDMSKHEMTPSKQRFLENFNRITATLGINTSEVRGSGMSNLMGDNNVAENLTLGTLGLDKSEKDFIKKKYNTLNYNKIPESERPELINRILLNRLKTEIPELTEEEINKIVSSSDATKQVQDRICQALHLTREEIEEISRDKSGKYVDKVKDALAKMKDKDAVRISSGRHGFFPSWFQPLERDITMSGVFNNLYSITDGAKTLTGKLMAKATQIIHRCLTFGGGRLGVLIFIAPAFFRAVINTIKADKDQKIGTFANGAITGVSWIVTFPLAMKLMHAIGGMNYAGMTKDEVQKYRDELQKLQENNVNGVYKTKAEYKEAAKKVLDIKKKAPGLKNQTLFTKLGKMLGSFLEIGNENPKGWNNPKSLGIVKWFRKKNFHRKDIIGAPLRFILFMAVFQGLLDKTIEKGIEKVFGKHYDETGAEEHIEKKKSQEIYTKEDLKKRMLEIQAHKQGINLDGTPYQPDENVNKDIQPDSEQQNAEESEIAQAPIQEQEQVQEPVQELMTNTAQPNESQLIQSTDNTKTQPTATYTYIPSSENIIQHLPQEQITKIVANSPKIDNSSIKNTADSNSLTKTYTYIPSSDNIISQQSPEKDQNKYIPSQKNTVVKTFDNSNLNSALARADRAEQRALDVLAGKFDDI